MDFVQKSNILLSLFFTEIMSEKIVFGYFKEKTIISDQKLKFQQGPKNGLFFKGVSPWTWFKNRTFSYLLFSQKFYQKTSFLILWKEKNDFKWKKLNFCPEI